MVWSCGHVPLLDQRQESKVCTPVFHKYTGFYKTIFFSKIITNSWLLFPFLNEPSLKKKTSGQITTAVADQAPVAQLETFWLENKVKK